jgi:alpha-L-rhamnosidase
LGWEFHKAYDDRKLLEEAYQPMRRWLDFLDKSVSADGVLTAYESPSRFLGDWATPHGSEYGDTAAAQLFNNCVYALCLDSFVQAAEILGRTGDAGVYSARLADLRRHAHRHFFNPETKTYLDGRQLALAFPLHAGITPVEQWPPVFANFVQEIGTRKPYLDTGSSGLPILLAFIVEKAERPDLLFPCLARTEEPGYGYFLKSGETTWPEYWKIRDEPSRIHTCYTGIAGYFIKSVSGIRPDPSAWGMKKFLIKPHLVGDLAHAHAVSASLYGPIVSNWRRSGTTAVFEIEVPVNTSAKVFIPAAGLDDVRVSDGPAAAAPGVSSLGMQDACAVFEVGAGVYQFSSSSLRLPP